jgi:hypothetical protein
MAARAAVAGCHGHGPARSGVELCPGSPSWSGWAVSCCQCCLAMVASLLPLCCCCDLPTCLPAEAACQQLRPILPSTFTLRSMAHCPLPIHRASSLSPELPLPWPPCAVLAMSSQAYNAFTEDQHKVLRKHVAALHHAPIDTLERIGGGGVRCTLAEIF